MKEGRVTQTGQERFHRERRRSVCLDPDGDEENLFFSPLQKLGHLTGSPSDLGSKGSLGIT